MFCHNQVPLLDADGQPSEIRFTYCYQQKGHKGRCGSVTQPAPKVVTPTKCPRVCSHGVQCGIPLFVNVVHSCSNGTAHTGCFR